MVSRIPAFVFTVFLLSLVACTHASVDDMPVVGVDDGDSLTVMLNGQEVRVRIHGIDAPERKQPFSNKSRQALSEAVFGKSVQVEKIDEDRWGRLIAKVYLDGQDIGVQQVQQGMAWHYTRFSDEEELARAQRQAQEARRGLWQEPEPEAPWDYRKRMRGEGNWSR